MSVDGPLDVDPESIDTLISVRWGGEQTNGIAVFSGDFELEGEPLRTEHDGVEYDRYETDSGVAAVYDGHLVLSDSRDGIRSAIDARRGEADRLLETRPAVEAGLRSVDHDHMASVTVGHDDAFVDALDVDPADVRYIAWGLTVPDENALEMTFDLGLVDADAVSKDLIAAFEENVTDHRGPFLEEPTTEVDDASITVSFAVDREAKREFEAYEHPRGLEVREIDRDAEYVEIELRRGEPTPVDDLTLELNGEVYDPDIWAGDAETIEAGDVIRIRTADVEPDTEITLRHEMNGRTSSATTSILDNLEFEYHRDHESGTLTVTYRDEFRLSGDEITIAVFDMNAPRSDGESEPERTLQPWTGQTVEAGEKVEIDDVQHGKWITVQRGGESFGNAISHHRIRPPGNVSFEHDRDAGRLAITLEFEHDESRPADEYEIRVDGEPAETQWDGERIESGSTVRLEAPGVGQQVTVVWGDGDYSIGSKRIRPAVDVEFDLQDGLTLEHAGGPSLPLEDLHLHAVGDDVRSHTHLAEITEGQFAEGDTLDVDLEGDLDDVEALYLVYDGMLIAQYPDEA